MVTTQSSLIITKIRRLFHRFGRQFRAPICDHVQIHTIRTCSRDLWQKFHLELSSCPRTDTRERIAQAVELAQEKYPLSECRACRLVGRPAVRHAVIQCDRTCGRGGTDQGYPDACSPYSKNLKSRAAFWVRLWVRAMALPAARRFK